MKCKITGDKLSPFMSFGKMPSANGFLDKTIEEWQCLERPMANRCVLTFDGARRAVQSSSAALLWVPQHSTK